MSILENSVIIFEPVQKLILSNVGDKLKDKITGDVSDVISVDSYDGAVSIDNTSWYYVEFGTVISAHIRRPAGKKMCSSNKLACHDIKTCMFSIFTPNGKYKIGEIL